MRENEPIPWPYDIEPGNWQTRSRRCWLVDPREIEKLLKAPFDPEDIEWRVGSTNKEKTKGLALAYVTNRAIQNRLDEVFGIFGWRNEFTEWKGGAQLCGISVKVGNEWITKWDGAADSNMEAVKGGLSDAMKRAAYQWGIGRYLYKLPPVWVDLKGGKYLAETPQLPAWALPKARSTPPKPTAPKKDKPSAKCADCGKDISERIVAYSSSKYGTPLCIICQKKQG